MNKRNTSSRKGPKRKYQIEMTSWSIFLLLCCLSFLMAWIFVLGILVGRGFLPESVTAISDLKSQLNRFQGMVSHSKRPEQGIQKKEDYDSKLAFHHELSNKKDEQKKRGFSEPKWEPLKKEPSQSKREFTQDSLPEAKAEAASKEPAAKKKAETPKATVPEIRQKESTETVVKKQDVSPARGGFTIQLASMEERSKAEEAMRRWVSRGYDVYYYEVKIRGKTWYRVRCGKFATRDEAEEYAAKLSKETGTKGLVAKLE